MNPESLSIIVPVYNESENFPHLWTAITSEIRSPYTVIAVYDFEEDTTIPVVRNIIATGERRLELVKNRYGRGVVGAIRTGFDMVEHGPVLVLMADLSDDLRQVDEMFELYRQGNQIVVGSRYMKGGKLIGGPWLKQTLSRFAGVSLHWLRGLPTHDATNAFKIYDSKVLRTFVIESHGGFELNLELTVKAFLARYRITEVPATWRDRTAGKSQFKLWKWLPLYLRWYLYAFQPKNRVQTAAGNTPLRSGRK